MMNSMQCLILVKTQYGIRGLSIHETFQYPVFFIYVLAIFLKVFLVKSWKSTQSMALQPIEKYKRSSDTLYPWEDAGGVTTTTNPMTEIDSKLKRISGLQITTNDYSRLAGSIRSEDIF